MSELDVIENTENGSWGFRIPLISRQNSNSATSTIGWLNRSGLSNDSYYYILIYNFNEDYNYYEFWFENKETAVMARLMG